MRLFADLYDRIDQTTSTNAKVQAIADYIAAAPPDDAAWAVFFLTGRRMRRLVPSADLSAVLADLSSLPGWIISECYSAVGDFAETIALVLGATGVLAPTPDDTPLHVWVEDRVESLRGLDPIDRRRLLTTWLTQCDARQTFLLVKLLTGELRVGVSSTLVTRALAQSAGIDADLVAHRLMGEWRPSAEFLARVLSPQTTEEDVARPYPFYLATPIDPTPEHLSDDAHVASILGDAADYLVEWKWDGIRAQLIRRGRTTAIWSRGEELLTDRFPEVIEAAARLPAGTVLDGEILAYKAGHPLAFGKLQKRIGRQNITARALAEAPVVFMAYDVLEHAGVDVRPQPLVERRRLLSTLVGGLNSSRLLISPLVEGTSWPQFARQRRASRERRVEGLMLKRLDSPYGVGRERGAWWKWKIDPYSIDAVLVYAQPGHGRRASLLTDYTFAVRDGDQLVPIAKAYSGLTLDEINKLDGWIRQNTLERFGPVRVVKPEHVFELHFEAMAPSTRHRSGIAFRFPRIARWRSDKLPADADTLADVRRLMASTGHTLEPTMFDDLDDQPAPSRDVPADPSGLNPRPGSTPRTDDDPPQATS
ncbi:MAG: DNA ligase [Phycisphaerales bacterium]|nr:DNA ligase [Phycisphaerales bacterium]